MTRQSRDARQDQALVNLLRALPEDRLERILAGCGVDPERMPSRKADDRHCDVCGYGYVRCRAADPLGDHDWTPVRRKVAP